MTFKGEKRGREVPGPLKKSPGTFRVSRSCPGRTTGPSRSLGPVLSCPVPGPSRDFPGRDSPAGKPSTYHENFAFVIYKECKMGKNSGNGNGVCSSDGNRTVPSRVVPGRSRDGTGQDRT